MLQKDIKDTLLRRLQACGDSLLKKTSGSSAHTQATPTMSLDVVELFEHFDTHFYIFNEPTKHHTQLYYKRTLADELTALSTVAHSQQKSHPYSRRNSKEVVKEMKDLRDTLKEGNRLSVQRVMSCRSLKPALERSKSQRSICRISLSKGSKAPLASSRSEINLTNLASRPVLRQSLILGAKLDLKRKSTQRVF